MNQDLDIQTCGSYPIVIRFRYTKWGCVNQAIDVVTQYEKKLGYSLECRINYVGLPIGYVYDVELLMNNYPEHNRSEEVLFKQAFELAERILNALELDTITLEDRDEITLLTRKQK